MEWIKAAHRYSVAAVPRFNGTPAASPPGVTLTDRTTSESLSCDSSTAKVIANDIASGLSATNLIKVSGANTTWTNCVGAGETPLNISGFGFWEFNAFSYNAATGVTTGQVAGVHATVSTPDGTTCVFSVKGPLPATYTNSTQVLAVLGTKANLAISGVTGCLGLVNNGDKASLSVSYQVGSPVVKHNPLQITSP